MGAKLSNAWTGKVDLDKLIRHHEREAWLGSAREQEQRAKFHESAVRLLKKIKETTNG